MGIFDMLFSGLLVGVPVLLLITAVRDWRRSKRRAYLWIIGGYALVAACWIWSFFLFYPDDDIVTTCGSGFFFLAIVWLFQRNRRRAEKEERGAST